MKPTVGRVVLYRSKTGNYTLPALVTATVETLWTEGVDRGDVPALSSDQHVHLMVFTPGAAGLYVEHDVPPAALDDETGHAVERAQNDTTMPGRSWAWPAREG